MRLTSEGAARIADEIVVHHSEHGEPVLNMTELENCQFEPSDFEDVVVLTVEQAKIIISLIKESFELMNCDLSDGSTSLDLLYEGIKQAEGKE